MSGAQRPNIVLIVADAVRAKNMSVYGHINQTTPFLESFTNDATLYNHAYSPGSWSIPSHTSLFTGYPVVEHELTTHSIGPHRLEAGHTIWESLAEEGYSTAEFVQGHYITSDELGLARGFDSIMDRSDFDLREYPFNALDPSKFTRDPDKDDSPEQQYLKAALMSGKPIRALLNGASVAKPQLYSKFSPSSWKLKENDISRQISESFLEWQTQQDGPWAAFLNLPSAHGPYLPKPEFNQWGDERLRKLQIELHNARWEFYSGRTPWWVCRARESLYDGCIRQIDAAIERIIQTLRQRSELDETLVVITADHGEGFGEASRVRDGFRVVTHRSGVHETVLHVPLIVRSPDQNERKHGKQVDGAASLTYFPSAVKHALEGKPVYDVFTPEEPVISAANYDHLVARMESDDAMWTRGYKDEIDISMFGGTARVVYKNTEEGVRKYAQWGDDEAVIEIRDAQNSMKVADSVDNTIDKVFADYSPKHVLEEDETSISEETKEQLQEMGYL